MNPILSLYLHLARFGAAGVVVASHIWPVVEPTHPLPWPGHEAVVVFFVLSGLVIAYATDRRGKTLGSYSLDRLARLWSVVVPALLLGAAISQIGGLRQINEAAPVMLGQSGLIWGSLANLGFVAQVWNFDLPAPLNAPFWSLSYEAWYYVIFGAFFYLQGTLRYLAVMAACVAAGPRILLLFPVWAMGVAVYRCKPALSERAAVLLFVATLVVALAYLRLGVSIHIRVWMHGLWPAAIDWLHGSNQFAGDILLGMIVSLNFLAARSLGRFGLPLLRFRRPIELAASYTLSAYLYHMPFFVLLWNGFEIRSRLVYLVLALLIVALGWVTEHRLGAVRAFLSAGVGAWRQQFGFSGERP